MPRLLLLFSQNVNHSPEFWRLSRRKSHLCPPKSLKMLLIPRFCCQQYSCVKERNLQIAAKLREFDCNVSNRVIVSFLVLVFFLPLPNTECLIFEQRSCYIKAIHYILYQLKQVRSALSGAWVLEAASNTEQISVRSVADWKRSSCLDAIPDPAGCRHAHTSGCVQKQMYSDNRSNI